MVIVTFTVWQHHCPIQGYQRSARKIPDEAKVKESSWNFNVGRSLINWLIDIPIFKNYHLKKRTGKSIYALQ